MDFTGTPIYKDGRLMLEQPEYCKREKYLQLMETFQPIYPLTTGLSNKTVQKHRQLHLKCTEKKSIFRKPFEIIMI